MTYQDHIVGESFGRSDYHYQREHPGSGRGVGNSVSLDLSGLQTWEATIWTPEAYPVPLWMQGSQPFSPADLAAVDAAARAFLR